ncbi:hypothetical protein B7P43_G02532 [Cryptotermes secundus]|uniref:Uncharacterized protein n=1 Tax=Cryptotermes secundus TaxID=105785 RepID=A0A2J7Q2J6_9NEOP|nr:hypothetical protein B7P43_G02532 [Cryptotermes secundus]
MYFSKISHDLFLYNLSFISRCETWSLTLREEHRLRVTGGWRKLHNEELLNLYSSPSVIRMIWSWRMRWAEHVARMGRRGMNVGEIGWDGMDWLDLAQDREQWRALVNTVMNLRVP